MRRMSLSRPGWFADFFISMIKRFELSTPRLCTMNIGQNRLAFVVAVTRAVVLVYQVVQFLLVRAVPVVLDIDIVVGRQRVAQIHRQPRRDAPLTDVDH